MKNKTAYCNTPVVNEFIGFFCDVVAGEIPLFCDYTPASDKKNKFTARSFQDGVNHYWWAGRNFPDTKLILDGLRDELRQAMAGGDSHQVLIACLKTLEWGGVYRGAVGWLAEIATGNELIGRIRTAINILDGDSAEDMPLFDEFKVLRCDSGTTKIFSLGAERSVIYDGRVACALGMLIVDFLTKNGVAALPQDLNFLMDADYGRRPSANNHKFINKSQKNKAKNHAVSNLQANWIVEAVAKRLIETEAKPAGQDLLSDKMREIEASLFMLGYKCHESRFSACGSYLI